MLSFVWSMDNTGGSPSRGEEPPMKTDDWRSQLPTDSRERIVNKILDILKRHLPYSGDEGIQELKKIAVRFEEKIHACATSQSDYLRKISLKMLTMESRSQNTVASSLPSNSIDASMQQGRQTMPSMEHSRIKVIPLQYPDNQMNSELQSLNNMMSLQQFPSSSLSGVSTAQKSMFNPSPYMDYNYYMQQAMERQRKLYQAQISLSATSPTSLDSIAQIGDTKSTDRQEEIYQKINLLNEMYHPELTQVPSIVMQMKPQLQSSALPMQQNNVTSLQQLNYVPSLSSVSTADIISPWKISSDTELGHVEDSPKSLQQVSVGSFQQTPGSYPQQADMNALSSESGTNMKQENTISSQTNVDFPHNRYLQQQKQLNLMKLRSQQQQQQQQQLNLMLLRSQQQQQQQQQQQWKQMHLPTHQQPLQFMQHHQVSHQTRKEQMRKLMFQKFKPEVPHVNTVSDMNIDPLLPSQSASNVPHGSIGSLDSSSRIVVNKQHQKQEQEEKKLQNQPMQPCQYIPIQQQWTQKPQMLLEKQQQQIQQLQQQAKQQLHHIYFVYLIFLTILLGAYLFGSGY